MTKLLVIDDDRLQAMAKNQQILAILPCLASAATVATGKVCTPCQRRRRAASPNLAHARRCVANARGTTLNQLKTILGASKLRIVARTSHGKSIQWTL